MHGIRRAGVGVALALATTPAVAQTPAPAATLGKVNPVGATVAEPVVRGAAPAPRPTSLFPSPAYRMQNPTPPGGGGFPQPKPVEGQPNVTETRVPPGGTPGTVTPPTTVPPAYVVPGGGSYPYAPYPGAATPPPTAVYPGGPAVSGPVCDPYYGSGGTPVPVAPSPPMVIAGDGGFLPQPRLEDPYWGPWWNPLFPRVRSAVSNTFTDVFSENRLRLSADYLLWFARAQDAPPLLTTSSPQFNGIIGQGDTRVIYGNQKTTNTLHNGARFGSTFWLNDLWAIDGNVWFLAKNSDGFTADTSQYPLLARPFFNVNTGQNFSQVIGAPGLATGSARIDSEISLWGNEVNIRRALLCYPCSRLDGMIGFRNMNLNEELNITESFARTPDSPPSIGVPNVTSGVVQDRFRTENQFYGVNLGLAGELRRGWWYLSGRVGVGLGTVNQQATIAGFQQLNTTTGVTTAEGGLLALPGANIGRFSQSRFGVLPDVGLTLGVYVTPNLRLGVGYNLIYLNSVVRPAGQIDPGLDVTRIPNFPLGTTPPAVAGVRPSAFPLRTTDFFVQGITFSLMWSF